MTNATHEPGERYDGPVQIAEHEVHAQLRGHFEPIDGRFHWWGRLDVDEALAREHRSGAAIVLATPHGTATARLSDVDPWGRFRVSGTGRPPF